MPLKLKQIVELPEKRESNEDMVGFNAIINSISTLEVKKEKVLELLGYRESGISILKNKQLISDPINGDCFRACLLGILGIPNSEIVPACSDAGWFLEYSKFLGMFGLNFHYEEKACWRNGYWIASVKSLNFPDVTHAIIMNCQEVFFDPSPNKKYTEGENLLGKDVVLGGWYLEVEDFSKLCAKFLVPVGKEKV